MLLKPVNSSLNNLVTFIALHFIVRIFLNKLSIIHPISVEPDGFSGISFSLDALGCPLERGPLTLTLALDAEEDM